MNAHSTCSQGWEGQESAGRGGPWRGWMGCRGVPRMLNREPQAGLTTGILSLGPKSKSGRLAGSLTGLEAGSAPGSPLGYGFSLVPFTSPSLCTRLCVQIPPSHEDADGIRLGPA